MMSRSSRRTTPVTELDLENILNEEELGRGARLKNKKLRRKILTDEFDEDVVTETDPTSKPSEVLLEEENVSGKTMFGFERHQSRGGMSHKVSKTINRVSMTPKKTQDALKVPPKTPRTVRTKIKKKLAALVTGSSSEDFEDFSESGSDFKPNDSCSSETEAEEELGTADSDESCSDKDMIKSKMKIQRMPDPSRGDNDDNYVMKSDDYFAWQANSKIITSNHTLQKLKTPKLSEDQLQELLTSCTSEQSTAHDRAIRYLFKSNCCNFNKWLYIMNEGFSILLYGLGSKRDILKVFQQELLHSVPVVVVNGYFPSLTIKDVLDGILVEILEESGSTINVYEAVDQIKSYFEQPRSIHLYILVHNIDGPMLRNNKSQNVLSYLASIPNVHLLATIDHINTPLIWDHSKLSKFNFTWWDATTFLSYTDETSFESSMLVQRSGALALSSLTNVYQSLTKNSKGVFMLIVQHQLSNKAAKHYLGMPFKVLYSQCRENFLVSSDLALRAQLTEFLDHKLFAITRR
ncbi:Origin recognition complex subunit 2 [Carabus blaptoides fortunei]